VKSNRKSVLLLSALLTLGTIGTANAAGCLKGAVVGGVAGHYAGHHAVAGAVGGCIVGHHLAKKHAQEKKEAQLRAEQAQ
jgi:outer membrane lipoprotein SlyB